MVWYSHLEEFFQFVVIHRVEGFDVINKAEVDVFLKLSYFFDDPVDVGNLISGSSAFSKSSLNICKFTVHVLLKPGLENFAHQTGNILWRPFLRQQTGISLRASSGPPPSDWELPEGRGESECLWQPSTPRHLQLEDAQPAAFLSLTMPRAGLTRSPSRSCQQAAKPQRTPGIN